MRILHINKFFYLKGGPEKYMFSLSELLESKGQEVAFFSMRDKENVPSKWERYFVENIDYNRPLSFWKKLKVAVNMLYSREAEKKLSELIDDFKPNVAHLHNFSHQLSPSVIFTLNRKRVPFVMTFHDYKLVCPSYMMLNHGALCELCKGGKFYNCVWTKCYKDSRLKSLLLTVESYLHHMILNSYRQTRFYIFPSHFALECAKRMGLKGDFVHIPHFAATKDIRVKRDEKGIVYFGRLSPEKGIMTLLKAVKGLDAKLTIIGEGPQKKEIEDYIEANALGNVELAGHIEGQSLIEKIGVNLFSVVPSEWYEILGLVIIEAYSLGLPVIGADIGGIPEVIKQGETGFLFKPGDSTGLREKMEFMLSHPDKASEIGEMAKRIAIREYGAEDHYKRIMEIYEKAILKSS